MPTIDPPDNVKLAILILTGECESSQEAKKLALGIYRECVIQGEAEALKANLLDWHGQFLNAFANDCDGVVAAEYLKNKIEAVFEQVYHIPRSAE